MSKKNIMSMITLLFTTTLLAQDLGTNIAMEILKDDIIQSRRDIIKTNIELPERVDSTFWAIYDIFEAKQKPFMDTRAKLITEYATAYYTMSDAAAQDLALRTFKNDKGHAKLKEKTFKKFSKEVSPTVAFRFMQLYNRIGLMIELQLVSEIPVLPAKSKK